jgi:hypothetical protein
LEIKAFSFVNNPILIAQAPHLFLGFQVFLPSPLSPYMICSLQLGLAKKQEKILLIIVKFIIENLLLLLLLLQMHNTRCTLHTFTSIVEILEKLN